MNTRQGIALAAQDAACGLGGHPHTNGPAKALHRGA